MLLSHSMRFSGKNGTEWIKNLTPEQYQKILLIENKLLDLCAVQIEEPSQQINMSDIEIVETFNANSSSKKKTKHDDMRVSVD